MDSLQVEISWVNRHQMCTTNSHQLVTTPIVHPFSGVGVHLAGRTRSNHCSSLVVGPLADPPSLGLWGRDHWICFRYRSPPTLCLKIRWPGIDDSCGPGSARRLFETRRGTKTKMIKICNSVGRMTTLSLFSFSREPNPIRILWGDVIYPELVKFPNLELVWWLYYWLWIEVGLWQDIEV